MLNSILPSLLFKKKTKIYSKFTRSLLHVRKMNDFLFI